MVYVGVVASLLTIEMGEVEKAIRKQFAKKVKAANLNLAAAQAGFDYAKANLQKRGAFYIERMNETAGKIIIDGNSAAALGCMFAGCTVVTWYPITPSSSLVETMIEYMKEYRIGPDGKATFAIVQAEDELAAIGMVIGAGWAGARSMTATAGPGISLMSEFAGLAYYVEVPGVIWDIQRVGPSTGLPTRTSQGDILSTAFLSHGDTKNIMLFPCSVDECFSMAPEAFNLAEQFQTLVFVMSDLDLGMNNWMSDPFEYPTTPINRGKVLSKEDLDRLGGFARYKDVDGDGIGYRTLPGTIHPAAAYFARGSGHNERAQYSERADDFENNMERLNRKFETARSFVPRPEITQGQQRKNRHHRLRNFALGHHREPRSTARRIRHRDRLSAPPGLSLHSRSARVHRAARPHLRRRAESRRADAHPAQARSQARADHAPAQHRPHHRTAARRAVHHRRTDQHGGQVSLRVAQRHRGRAALQGRV